MRNLSPRRVEKLLQRNVGVRTQYQAALPKSIHWFHSIIENPWPYDRQDKISSIHHFESFQNHSVPEKKKKHKHATHKVASNIKEAKAQRLYLCDP
jgi:hypothetical protein